ncbi:MAG: aspartate carbamoyltransferase regulatory subunit [Clostridia bacterium]|nr:aspartate carbamoyltransferase regulatory subunit [Clostridia bacterium]
MIVNPIENGVVLDHITAGKAMDIYKVLRLDKLGCTVAVIVNAPSKKMGRKDVLKIYDVIDLNFDVLGYLDPGITVSIIENGDVVRRISLDLPEQVEGVLRCKNPRCITSCEQELPQVFKLTDRKKKVYRCIYCETMAKNK